MKPQPRIPRWASHDVRFHNTGTKRSRHTLVGELTLNFERFDLAAESGLTMFTYTAEPGTRSAEGLDLLASWAVILPAPLPDPSHFEQADQIASSPNAGRRDSV